jgi:hypothetical protein
MTRAPSALARTWLPSELPLSAMLGVKAVERQPRAPDAMLERAHFVQAWHDDADVRQLCHRAHSPQSRRN